MLDTNDRLEHALGLAYRYLNRRDRTEAEVRAHLVGSGVDAETAAESIRALCEQGYLDDTRFAHTFAQDKRELEAWGSDRIRRTLLARGIDCDLAQAVLENEATSERDRALVLLRRRFPLPPRDRRDRERALGVLLRKGFDTELALEALADHARGAT